MGAGLGGNGQDAASAGVGVLPVVDLTAGDCSRTGLHLLHEPGELFDLIADELARNLIVSVVRELIEEFIYTLGG